MAKTETTSRTLAGVREALFHQLDQLRNGGDVKQAQAVALVCKGILDSASIQLKFEEAWHAKKIADKLRAIELVPSLKHETNG